MIFQTWQTTTKNLYKNLYKSIRKGQIFPTEIWVKDLNRYLTKEDI